MSEKRPRGRPKSDQPTQQVAFRFPPALIERLDTYAAYLRTQTPGVTITRADAVRSLLEKALEAFCLASDVSASASSPRPYGKERKEINGVRHL